MKGKDSGANCESYQKKFEFRWGYQSWSEVVILPQCVNLLPFDTEAEEGGDDGREGGDGAVTGEEGGFR